jgi:ferritin-like metal-binding protein YciE
VRHQSTSDQLVKDLADAHSLEEQALEQLTVAPKLAGEGRISAAFAQHLGDGKSANLILLRRVHAFARLSLPRPSATRGWG